MPNIHETARLWKAHAEHAEPDYIGPFVKSWAAFNAWFREASTEPRNDAKGLHFVKQKPNVVRQQILPLLCAKPPQNRRDEAKELTDLIYGLHVRLEECSLEILIDDTPEKISFKSVCLKKGGNIPKKQANNFEYFVTNANKKWISTVISTTTGVEKLRFEQDKYNLQQMRDSDDYARLSVAQQNKIANLYAECNPRPLTNLLSAGGAAIPVGDVKFKCSDEEIFCGIIDVIYSMRNAILHGELPPHRNAFAAYEPAYRIVMRFLKCFHA